MKKESFGRTVWLLFAVHLLSLNQNEEAEKIYEMLSDAGIEVLYDDREVSAGEKFADSDLIGIPSRIVISKKSIEVGGMEFKRRDSQESEIVKGEDLIEKIKIISTIDDEKCY